MRHRSYSLLAAAALCVAVSPALSEEQTRPTRKPREAQEASRKARKPAKPRTLYGIRWYAGVEDAIAASTQRKEKKLPVFWLRVLGDLEGKT